MKARKISMVLLLMLCLALCSCSSSEKNIPDSAVLVLNSILEYPNEDLYTPSSVIIGIDEDPGDIDYEGMQEAIDADTENWEETIGDCFAENMFDSFYQQWERTAVIGYAYANSLDITVNKIELLSQEDNVYHIQTTIEVTDKDNQVEKYDLEWRLIFDKDTPNLIQSVELINDDGLIENKN